MSRPNPAVGGFMHQLAKFLFRVSGWKIEGELPESRRGVIIAAPHTSNWDAILMLIAAHIFRVRMSGFVKQQAFFFPLGILTRYFGGVPIDRSKRNNVVEQAVAKFAEGRELLLAVPPEATRKKSPYWKTGFYHIARGAGVPIVLGYIDFKRKVAGVGPAFTPSGDIEADFRYFDSFYAPITPKFPEQRGTVAVDPRALKRDAA
jgi:1-acyl-sn-glycerol-3-phosphate acyltransferase